MCFSLAPLIYKGIELYTILKGQQKIADVELPDERFIDLEDEEERDKVLSELPIEDKAQAQLSVDYFKRRYTGFAFSGEAGHTPQLTDGIVYRNSIGW